MTVEGGDAVNVPVSVCGEMAGDELYTLVLMGLGVKELSMHAASIPRVKRVISRTTMEEARELADRVLAMETADQVHNFIEDYLRNKYPGLLDPLASEE
jgi:phosphotransferase system enzyme I (PtsI)